MKLGFWNRLALVAGGLTLLIVPAWSVLSYRQDVLDARLNGHSTCTRAAADRLDVEGYAMCREIWLEDYWMPGWTNWAQALAETAVAVAVLYALLWIAVKLAKWIWRGRAIS